MDKEKRTNNRDCSFFINPQTGRRAFNPKCKKCVKDCKQSYRVQIISCRDYRTK